MARCSNCGGRCTCKITAGSNITIEGAGTAQNPMVISASGGGEGGGVPTATIVMFGGSAAPAGWLICAGQAVSRNTFAALFAVIGTVYGPGDGSTTFTLPDLAGRGPFGADSGHALGSVGGNEAINLTPAQIPTHRHTIAHVHGFDHNHAAVNTSGFSASHHHGATDAQGNHAHTVSISNVASRAAGNQNNIVAGGGPIGTSADGVHAHNTGWASNDHVHAVQVPTFVGNTAGSSAAETGNAGAGDPINIMTPYTAVTFLIKT